MLSDQDGLDRAYASNTNLFLDGRGTLFVAGTKGHFWDKEWNENYRDFGETLFKKFGATAEKMAKGDAKGAFDTLANPTVFDVSKQDSYKQLEAFIKSNPDKVKKHGWAQQGLGGHLSIHKRAPGV